MSGAPTPAELQLTAMPGEILNKIYNDVFIQDEPLDLWAGIAGFNEADSTMARLQSSSDYARPKFGFGLLRTNRKLHNECNAIFYSSTRFDFSRPGGWDGLLLFLKTIGKENRGYLQRVGVITPVQRGGIQPLSLMNPGHGFGGTIPIMNHDESVVKETCFLLARESTLRELFFITPRGIEVQIVSMLVPPVLLRVTQPIQGGTQGLKMAMKVIFEIQAGGFLNMAERAVDKMTLESGWELVRKVNSYRRQTYTD